VKLVYVFLRAMGTLENPNLHTAAQPLYFNHPSGGMKAPGYLADGVDKRNEILDIYVPLLEHSLTCDARRRHVYLHPIMLDGGGRGVQPL